VVENAELLVSEVIQRAGFVKSYLATQPLPSRPDLAYTRATEWELLDPSERAYIHYFLGMMAAKILAQRLHNVNHLLHLDVYRESLDPGFWSLSGQRPDLLGLAPHQEWIVVESKGRGRSVSQNEIKSAKKQTQHCGRYRERIPF
jgi:hypothetical protein